MRTIQIVLIVALLLCLCPMPYGYYTMVRLLAAVVFAIMTYDFYQKRENMAAGISLFLTLLFQPFFKIALEREVWNVIDVVVAIILAIMLWGRREIDNKDKDLEGIIKAMNDTLFPGGEEQIEKEVQLLCSQLHGKYSKNDVKNTLGYISYVLFAADDKSQDGIVKRVLARPRNNLDKSSIIVIYQFVAKKALKKGGMMADADQQQFLDIVNGNMNKGCTGDVIPNGYGEFGLTATNPVPVKGILANAAYLSKLRTLKGEELKWDRKGSTHAPNIDSPIDIYHVTTLDGKDMGYIYISPYQNHTSVKAPRGFLHVDDVGSSQRPLPICYKQIYNMNLSVADIEDQQGNLLTSTSMREIIPLLIKCRHGETDDRIEKAEQEYLSLAQQGYADAYNNLAIMEHFLNNGNDGKVAKCAIDWFQQGAEAGSLRACFNLSVLEEGDEGFAWNKKGVDRIKGVVGDETESWLVINMAIRYHFGYGCSVDLSKAKGLYNMALRCNSNIVENNLGVIFMEEGNKEQARRMLVRAMAERSYYRNGIDAYEVISAARYNLQLI